MLALGVAPQVVDVRIALAGFTVALLAILAAVVRRLFRAS